MQDVLKSNGFNCMQPHIKCKKGDVAKFVLLPGDPARVKKIASYWDNAKEISNNREFLTYTGTYKGIKISATSTGIGGPSAAIAVEELANIGAQVFIRIGTCGALNGNIKSGDLVIPYASIRAEGTTKEYLPSEFPAVTTPEVFNALTKAAENSKSTYFTGVNRTHDAFYEHINNLTKWGEIYLDKRMSTWKYPLISSEMECAVVMLLPMLRGLKSGCILAVNTPEPLDKIAKNPDLIYKLSETINAKSGIDDAIKIALGAVEILAKNA